MEFFVMAYGNDEDKRQGIFRLFFNKTSDTIEELNFYPMKNKTVFLVKKENKLITSSIEKESKQSYLTVYTIDSDNRLIEEKSVKQKYFYSHLALADNGKYLLGASFYEGVDSVFDINNLETPVSTHVHKFRKRSDKFLQQSCHSHYINITHDKKFVYSADLGTDEILVYDFSNGKFTLNPEKSLDRTDGPRLMPFGRDGNYAYLLNELNSRINVFSYNNGIFEEIQNISMLAENYSGKNSAAGIKISENGKILAASNRGEDSVVIYDIDVNNGFLIFRDRIFTGRKPRDIEFMGNDYILVSAQDDNKIQIIKIGEKSVLLDNFYPIPTPTLINAL